MMTLVHGRVRLALYALRDNAGPHLLLLHGLGERSPEQVPAAVASWRGAVHALDLTGHGASTVPSGGGYSCEVMMADVDAALAVLGPCTILGRGLGGYVGLLIAGARPTLVRGLIIDDGPGLAGGGVRPGSTTITVPDASVLGRLGTTPDPYALLELSNDVRPPDYAESFVRLALQGPLDEPISVCSVARPPWLAAVAGSFGVRTESLASALARLAVLKS